MPLRFESRAARGAAMAALAALAACGGSTAPDTPVPSSVAIQPATVTLDALGDTTRLAAAVSDQHGQPMPEAALVWRSSNIGVATVGAGGVLTAVANGTTQVTATAAGARGQVTVTVAQTPDALVAVSGNAQSGVVGQTLAAPLVVQVNDRRGHPVSGVAVGFAAAAGSGSLAPASATTTSTGRATANWTLGTATGTQHAAARVGQVDSVSFTATAQPAGAAPSIAGIAPDTLVEGAMATITGANFGATAGANAVTIDGAAATVTGASATRLTVTVPAFACQPARLVTVTVRVGQQSASRASVPLHAAAMTTLAVGEEAMSQDPSRFCLQLPAAASAGAYIVGLSAPAETPSAVLPFVTTTRVGMAVDGMVAPLPNVAAARVAPAPAAAADPVAATQVARWLDRAAAEARLRGWEQGHLAALAAARRRVHAAVAPGAGPVGTAHLPVVGDTLSLSVPNPTSSDPCNTFTRIRAVVKVVGSAGIWVEDVANPTADSLTTSDIQSASNEFDSRIYAIDTSYFGAPSDVDANGHVIVVLTWQVNRASRILGFVFGGDLFPGPQCAESNGGELYYGQVPDPGNVAGTGARAKADVLAEMPQLIAHEFSHIIQMSQRAILHHGTPMTSWEMEGQATLAEELVGDAVLGNSSGQNYGASVAFGTAGYNWYVDVIVKWAEYYGALGANDQAPNAPELCTVYGNTQMTLPCDFSAFYGASWSLQRYIADQNGPSYPGGLQQLTRDWVSGHVSATGTANIAALLGVNYDSLFVRFATALALDDRPNMTVPQAFRLTSWNSHDLSTYLRTCCALGWLAPAPIGFANTTLSRSVRGGSTAYAIVSASGAHAAMAIQLTNPSGGVLSSALRPALWIVRVQ